MRNDFYTDFDLERFPETTTQKGDYRIAFRSSAIASFFLPIPTLTIQDAGLSIGRIRLLPHPPDPLHRGRQVGRSICEFLLQLTYSRNLSIVADLTEAICLAHDLGHPPFGHIGERKLNDLMAKPRKVLKGMDKRYEF